MKVKLLFAVVLSALVGPSAAHAANVLCFNAQATLVTGNLQTDTAHIIDLQGCSNLCGTYGNRAYIDFSEKELFAYAMTASLNNLPINVTVEKPATARGVTSHEPNGVSCRLVNIWGF